MRTGMDVKVGDEVFVKPGGYYGKNEPNFIPARVTKAARVWLEIECTNYVQSQLGYRTWRLRRDTQNDGTSGTYGARFLALDQAEREKQLNAANATLKLHGIDIRYESRWRSPSQRIALAAALEALAAEMDETADGESADGAR